MKTQTQKLAGMRRAELLGYRLGQAVEAQEPFQAAVEAETADGLAHAEA